MRQELREWAEELACRAGLDALPPSVRYALLVLALCLVAVAVWLWGNGSTGAKAVDPAVAGETQSGGYSVENVREPSVPSSLTVHVVGAVRRPGVYVLAPGSRASDAVSAAGGLLGNAEQSGINLARQVTDGEQLAVPVVGASPPAAASAGIGRQGEGGRVELNTATVDDLDTLPGVGPATAQKIIADRTENGPFRTVEDLMRVPGIGTKRFETLKDMIVVR